MTTPNLKFLTDIFLQYPQVAANGGHCGGEPRYGLAAQWTSPAPSRAGLKVLMCSNSTSTLNLVCLTAAMDMPAPPPSVPVIPAVLGAGEPVEETSAHDPQVWSIDSAPTLL